MPSTEAWLPHQLMNQDMPRLLHSERTAYAKRSFSLRTEAEDEAAEQAPTRGGERDTCEVSKMRVHFALGCDAEEDDLDLATSTSPCERERGRGRHVEQHALTPVTPHALQDDERHYPSFWLYELAFPAASRVAAPPREGVPNWLAQGTTRQFAAQGRGSDCRRRSTSPNFRHAGSGVALTLTALPRSIASNSSAEVSATGATASVCSSKTPGYAAAPETREECSDCGQGRGLERLLHGSAVIPTCAYAPTGIPIASPLTTTAPHSGEVRRTDGQIEASGATSVQCKCHLVSEYPAVGERAVASLAAVTALPCGAIVPRSSATAPSHSRVAPVRGASAPPLGGSRGGSAGDADGPVTPSAKGAGKASCKAAPLPPGKGSKAAGKGHGKATYRKREVQPRVPLKPLWWKCMRWREGEALSTVWEKIHQREAKCAWAELEQHFVAQPARQGSTKCSGSSAGGRGVRMVFEEKRRRQIWCALRKMPSNDAVFLAVENMDDNKLTSEQVELLLQNLPSAEERDALKVELGEGEVWDSAEGFMVGLTAIPCFAARIQAWAFLNTFEATSSRFEVAPRDITNACDLLQASPRIEQLLSMVLYVGNHLNAGTPRGRADGFDLSILADLTTIKSGQEGQPITLLDFIVQQQEEQFTNVEMMYNTGHAEFDTMCKARCHKISELESDLLGLVRQTEEQLMCLTGIPGRGPPAVLRLEERLGELRDLSGPMTKARKRFAELRAWFGVDEAVLEQTDEFFNLWYNFLANVRRSFDRLKLTREPEKASRALRTRSVSVRPQAREPQGPGAAALRAASVALHALHALHAAPRRRSSSPGRCAPSSRADARRGR